MDKLKYKADDFECEEFYNMMQIYRNAPITSQRYVITAYENVKFIIAKISQSIHDKYIYKKPELWALQYEYADGLRIIKDTTFEYSEKKIMECLYRTEQYHGKGLYSYVLYGPDKIKSKFNACKS